MLQFQRVGQDRHHTLNPNLTIATLTMIKMTLKIMIIKWLFNSKNNNSNNVNNTHTYTYIYTYSILCYKDQPAVGTLIPSGPSAGPSVSTNWMTSWHSSSVWVTLNSLLRSSHTARHTHLNGEQRADVDTHSLTYYITTMNSLCIQSLLLHLMHYQ